MDFSVKSLKIANIFGGVQNSPKLFECTFAEKKRSVSWQNFNAQPKLSLVFGTALQWYLNLIFTLQGLIVAKTEFHFAGGLANFLLEIVRQLLIQLIPHFLTDHTTARSSVENGMTRSVTCSCYVTNIRQRFHGIGLYRQLCSVEAQGN